MVSAVHERIEVIEQAAQIAVAATERGGWYIVRARKKRGLMLAVFTPKRLRWTVDFERATAFRLEDSARSVMRQIRKRAGISHVALRITK